jgi:hypothetical protein
MPKLNPVSRREFIARIRRLGLEVDERRGKGGEWMVVDPRSGERFTLPHLAQGGDVKVCYIAGMLHRFGFTRADWFRAKK